MNDTFNIDGLSVCAETVALYKAVSSGRRSFKALAMAAQQGAAAVKKHIKN